MNNELIKNNLVELYRQIANSGNAILDSIDPFQYAFNNNSAWPNNIFLPEHHLALEENQINNLKEKIGRNDGLGVLIIDEHLVTDKSFTFLKDGGFMPVGQWTNMAIANDNRIIQININHFDIKEVDTNNDDEFKNWLLIVETTLFNNKLLSPEIFKTEVNKNLFKLLIGFYKGNPVSSLLLYLGTNAGIYMVATISGFRKKGFGKAMMSYAHSKAFSLGHQYVVLQTTKEGMPLYESLGYKSFNKLILFFCTV